MSAQKVIIFDTSKQELGNPGSNLKKFVKKYKDSYKIGLNKDPVDYQKVKKAHLFVVAAPKEPFTPTEIQDLKKLVENGGNLLVFSHQGGDRKNNTNLSEATKKFGITLNSDCVIRTSFYKYFHPKQAYIHNGILNEQVTRVINGYAKEPKGRHNNAFALGNQDDEEEYQKESKRTGVDFVYVNGASLTVASPGNAILTCGPLTYPCNRPVCAVYQHPKSGGKLVVCGSVLMFTDQYFEQEENGKLMDFFLKFFFTQEVDFEFPRDRDDSDNQYLYVPDIAEIADNLKSCFHEGEEIPKDFNTMFETELFKYDFDLVPEVSSLFAKMEVKHEPLTLIVPQFKTPLLGLAPGVFPPVLKQLANPPLQLFDLDDQFSQQRVRLAQLTNKCEDGDLEYFIREAGDILGVSEKVKNRSEPKAILQYILDKVINFKKNNLG